MHTIEEYRTLFISYLKEKVRTKEPKNLYAPITYIMELGGKRLRPVLTLMTTEIFGTNYKKALDAAAAVEIFHNFSLVHDDIMDAAPLRRGKKTVHKKWDVNTGILSGDAMLITAYQFFETYEDAIFKDLAKIFSTTALQVCEGQQYDIDFESRDLVTIPEYLKMIEYKTAVLVAGAMKMGAIIAKAPKESQNVIYEFGKNLGIAFQLQDDYLDAFGDPKTFGKQVGGDIIENKKTFLFIKAMEMATTEQCQELGHLFSIQPNDSEPKVTTVKQIFKESGAAELARKEIENYTNKAFSILDSISIDLDKKQILLDFGKGLMNRSV
ncbi:geranylgeranyl diphosphate synthase type II [Saonia flava]|uniref:Geranylgeranyl diphosphate synthase type II n=1 Tax=Saonia flava TaxID=523696 RepID=A0A846QU11_9FLAO|nr:polyprenyl synthetase family protein [Saonia flava]NJB71701.1 geranylgeranyl diphosphate synthase type II [Saonia flava]